MFGRVAKTAVGTKTGRKASRMAAKGAWKTGGTKTARKAGKSGAMGLGRAARMTAKTKAGKEAGRTGVKGTLKAGQGFGRFAVKRGGREVRVAQETLRSGRSGGSRVLKFGALALIVAAVSVAVSRLLKSGDAGPAFTDTASQDAPDAESPAGERGETAGTGTPVGSAGGVEEVTARDSAYSDPSSGPLIGESHRGHMEGVGEAQPEVEQRVRTRIGEDERTRDMPRVNVEVIDGVVELRGPAPSEEAKEAAGEIAAQVEGVREVRNLIEVSS